MLYAIAAVIALLLDQAVKYWTTANIALNTGTKELIPHVVHLANVHNTGAAFSFLQGARWFFVVLCILFVIIVIYLLARNIIKSEPARWMAVLVMAGGIGNCIDRIVCGYVVDMFELSFKIFGRSFPVFNVADIFITVCGILFCIFFLLEPVEEKEKKSSRMPEKAVDPAPSPAHAESAPAKTAVPVRSIVPSKKRQKIEIPDFPKHPRVEQPEIDPNDPFAEWERIANKDSGNAAPIETSEAAEAAAPAKTAEADVSASPVEFSASIDSDYSTDFSSYIAAELAAIKAEISGQNAEQPAAEIMEGPEEVKVFSPSAKPDAGKSTGEAEDDEDENVDDVFSFFGRQKKEKSLKGANSVKKSPSEVEKPKTEKIKAPKNKEEKKAAPVKSEAPTPPKSPSPKHVKSEVKHELSPQPAEPELSFDEESYSLEDILEEFKDL